MSRHGVLAVLAAAALCAAAPIFATDPDRDFSGKWTLDRGSSRLQGLDTKVEPTLTIVQQEAAIHTSTNASAYALDGSETKYRIGDSKHNSAVKWEWLGPADQYARFGAA
mgnify:CR=1 FL=1